ncbi:hypothetical protein As57867_003848, partial [Aphanomyces stellatus]
MLSTTTRPIYVPRMMKAARFLHASRPSLQAGTAHFKTQPMSDQHFAAPNAVVVPTIWENPIPHPIYTPDEVNQVQETHRNPDEMHAKVALFAVRTMRNGFDIVSRYKGPGGGMTSTDWIHRCLFLETVAGVPGMVAGMSRHLRSLRTMQRDQGWIHTLLEEAENERMHLLIFMTLKQPGPLFRLLVLGGQGVFFNMFFLTYLISPKTCHRFVGYLEEEAVHTYTAMVEDIEAGHVGDWKTQ